MSSLFPDPAPQPKTDAREKRCKCGSRLAHCLLGNTAWCVQCVPPDFWPKNRGAK